MAIDEISPAFPASGNEHTRPELLVSALLHLMSHYTINTGEDGACIKLASVIERHFKVLADLPDLAPVLRATCQQLSEQWASAVEHALHQLEKRKTPSVPSRFFLGARSH